MEKQIKIPLRTTISRMPEFFVARISSWLGDWQNWLHIVLMFLVLEVAVFSIEQARWITPQPLLTLVLFLSVLFIGLLTLSRLHGVIIHTLALVAGILITTGQTLILLPQETSSLGYLLNILQSWWQASRVLQPAEERIIFAVFITFLTWLIGYLSAWSILRKRNAWVSVSLGLVVIIINLSNLPGKYFFFFPLFFIMAALLIIQMRFVKREPKPELGTVFTRRNLLYPIVSLVCIIVLAVSVSWVTPQVRASGLQNTLSTRITLTRDIRESKINVFNTVPAKQSRSTIRTRQDLNFEQRWHEGERIDFIVKSERPSYWRVYVYDTYTSHGWESGPDDEYLAEQERPIIDTADLSEQDFMEYTVTAGMGTDIILTTGGFISSDIPVIVHTGAGDDIIAVTAPRVLSPGESYSVKSFFSVPGPGELPAAGQNYPGYVTSKYLQLPPDFSEDIRRLSENITSRAKTPYDKVITISNYLRGFPYQKEIMTPIADNDGVEYFLFTQKSGFCLYFASAMTVMLRSVGVPARLAVGYLPGDPGEKRGEYILRDKYYHTWPQVYFPGFGWIDLEATPGGTGSQVSVSTPLISESTIDSSSQWNLWQEYLPYWLNYLPNAVFPDTNPQKLRYRVGPLPFADELGRALIIIFGGALIIFILISPLLALRSAFYRWLWHVDRTALAYHTYTNMCRLAALVKLGPRPQQTPLEFASELAALYPQEATALDEISRAYLENRFGRREGKLGLFEEAELLKARYRVYNALLQRLGFTRQLFTRR